jgi:cellobiose-specific phosphotransferase system component IIC
MDCKQCDILLPSYAAGELGYEEASEVRAHLENCECCRESLDVITCVVGAISDAPELEPTKVESAALSVALAGVRLPEPAVKQRDEDKASGFNGFVLASLAAFVLVAMLVSRQTITLSDIMSASLSNVLTVTIPLFAIIFVTSFIPIVITAKRRPLNGMTFRR